MLISCHCSNVRCLSIRFETCPVPSWFFSCLDSCLLLVRLFEVGDRTTTTPQQAVCVCMFMVLIITSSLAWEMDIKMIITLSAYEMGQSEHYAHSEINPFLSPTPRPSLGPEFTSQFSQIWTGTNSCIVGVSSAQFLRLLLCCLYRQHCCAVSLGSIMVWQWWHCCGNSQPLVQRFHTWTRWEVWSQTCHHPEWCESLCQALVLGNRTQHIIGQTEKQDMMT